jgi:hypothetical protein
VARFRTILDLQAVARATFAERIKGNLHTDPGGACCRAFEGQFKAFVQAIEHQLAWPLSAEGCRISMENWNPRESQNPDFEHDIQMRKILTYHMAGGVTGYSDTVKLVYTTPYDNYLDSDRGPTCAEQALYFALAPPDNRGHGYWLTPWGAQVGAMLLREQPELLVVRTNPPVVEKAPRKAAKPRRKLPAPVSPVWVHDARGHILAGGMPLFPDFLESNA